MNKRLVLAAIPLLAVVMLVLPVSAVCTGGITGWTAVQPDATVLTVNFDGTSNVACDNLPVPDVVTYAWSWGDATPDGNTLDATHTYALKGAYTVSLTVTINAVPQPAVTKTVYAIAKDPKALGTEGQTVFIGEEGLDVRAAMNAFPACAALPAGYCTKIAYYSAGSNPAVGGDAPAKVINIDPMNFNVASGDFATSTGSWYMYPDGNSGVVAFYVQAPSLDMKIWNVDSGKSVNDGSVVRPTQLTFRVDSNLYPAETERAAGGFLTLKMKDATGTVHTKVFSNTGVETSLLNLPMGGLNPLSSQWFLTGAGTVGAMGTNYQQVAGTFYYKAGTFEFWVESNLNKMKDNLGSVTGQTVSKHYTITLKDDTVTLAVSTETVIRGQDFSVSITGKPAQNYCLWIKDTLGLHETSPRINAEGAGITIDGACQKTAGVNQYARVLLDDSGLRTVGFSTSGLTKDDTYTIKVEKVGDATINDEIRVKVEKGKVTVDAAGTKIYYIGQEVVFSGENTDSDRVYLFIVGPNLAQNGVKLTDRTAVNCAIRDVNGNIITPGSNFDFKDVKSDDTWEFKWNTEDVGLDAGTYTVYAVSQPECKADVDEAKYNTVSIQLKKPFVNASMASPNIAIGDKVTIQGTAEGRPIGLKIWIFGQNRAFVDQVAVDDDTTFKWDTLNTDGWSAGQYFIVVQHPMYNNHFDIDSFPAGAKVPTEVWYMPKDRPLENRLLFKTNELMGSDAAQALVEELDKSNVDDQLQKLSLNLKNAYVIIDAVSEKFIGDKFTLKGTTNLAIDDTLIITINSASFVPTQKTQTSEFSGVSNSVKVVKGTGVDNVWSMEVDTSPFKPDLYNVKVEGVEVDVTGTTSFYVSEVPPTTVPTPPPVTTAPVTTAPVTTAPPKTTVPPTTTPGFGAVIALIGLGAVAVLVLRRH